MHKSLHTVLIVLAFVCSALVAPLAHAAVNLPWSTTFNCQEWKQSDGLYMNICDGITGMGAEGCHNGDGTDEEEQITAAANFPSGAGGRGQRHWKGDGTNNVSGGTKVDFPTPQPELWIRWYMRYEAGFKWNTLVQDKVLYIDVLMPWFVIFAYNWSDEVGIQSYGTPYSSGSGNGWNTIMANGGTDANGNKTADGLWHLYEIHIRMDTNGSDGVGEIWIDGVQRMSRSDINFGSQSGKTGWSVIGIGSNNQHPSLASCMAVDFDDIAIRTTGPIGPVGPADTLAPAAPSNLQVQ